ncbi:MAG: pyruvate kinase [Vicinamibacterales bacterium]
MAHQSTADVIQELESVRNGVVGAARRVLASRVDLPEASQATAANLLHYLALRQADLRPLQSRLASMGLSSLGRAESHVLANIDAVLDVLYRLDGRPPLAPAFPPARDGRSQLDLRTSALLGPPRISRDVRVMVTMPSEAAFDERLIRDLLVSGMDCMRINAAHDDPESWDRMLRHLSHAREETGRPCRVLIDLAGPRIRTGAMTPGPPVVRWRPERDACGRVVKPARIWLTSADAPRPAPESSAATLPVGGSWLSAAEVGDRVRLVDARGKKRALTVAARGDDGVWADSDQTAYVLPGIRLTLEREGRAKQHTYVGKLGPTDQSIVLRPGDSLVLVRDEMPGRPASIDANGRVLDPAVIGVSIPSIFDDLRPGQSIWFDDGRIGGTIRTTARDRVEVAIVHAMAEGSKLGPEKGINLPDSDLRLPSLTTKDLHDLEFIASHADIVGYSFVRSPQDVDALQSQLATMGGSDLGLLLKIETRQAFENLPGLLLAIMRSPASGVMIARGDLAVECGYERLAEVQEEILWMAEAAHTPVIWATQVLEQLAKDGIPSRAEITDAAMSVRAECVMLNKGPNIVEAVRALDDILTRMQGHQRKKSAMLRRLAVADRFLQGLYASDPRVVA